MDIEILKEKKIGDKKKNLRKVSFLIHIWKKNLNKKELLISA
jgi:hypothetical protein